MEYLVVQHLSMKILKRVFKRVEVDKTSGCWLWTGGCDPVYGLVYYKGHLEKVHRFMYAWLVAPLPRGREVRLKEQLDHVVCRNTRCCNPLHLEVVTQWENTRRGGSPPAINTRKNQCSRGHEFNGLWKKGEKLSRACGVCDRERRRNEDPLTRQRRRETCARNHQIRMNGLHREEYLKRNREAQARYRENKRAALLNG